jgi:hypothetical protein
MSALFPPPQTRVIGRATVGGVSQPIELDYAWFLYLTQGLYDRAGGALGASTLDLEKSAFEDAGVEETKAQLFQAIDEFRRVPVAETVTVEPLADIGIEELRGLVLELTREVEALKQGLIP